MKKLLIILPLVFVARLFSQGVNVPFVQSPNAASLGIYDKIDISPFTGLANISIPVFSVKEGDIGLNCQLSYFSGGVKPEQHPGWVGLNWSLSVGGQVTRKVNGAVDEVYIEALNPDNWSAYYDHYYRLAPANWYDNTFMQNFPIQYAPFRGEPDEFIFSLPNGISGSFFLNHAGIWQVKCKSTPGIKVEVDVNYLPFVLSNLNDPSQFIEINKLIYVIVITDPSGFRYTFGNQPNAIEFQRTTASTSTFNENVIANAWNLTRIESPSGNNVELVYVRKENQFVLNFTYPSRKDVNAVCKAGGTSQTYTSQIYGHIITPSYLSQIIASSFKVNFNIGLSNELKYPFSISTYLFNDYSQADLGKPVPHGFTDQWHISNAKYYKLDNIEIKDPSNIVRQKFEFIYSNDPSKRLTLQRCSNKTIGSGFSAQPYEFTYDLTPLPAYNSAKLDKWGYYNNNLFPISVPSNKATTLQYFEMNETYAKAGILTRIKYPTGGTTDFIYSLNDYSKVLQKTNNSINLENQGGVGGGLRIQEIISNDNVNTVMHKKYYYQLSGGSTSSGILAGISRMHITIPFGANATYGSVDLFTFDDKRSLNYTDGKEVVYSEVKEELEDGSFIRYKYSNSDNVAYRDEAPFNTHSIGQINGGIVSSSATNPYMSHVSRELERGQLLSQEYCNPSGTVIKKVENTYNDDPTRFNQFVRSIVHYIVGEQCDGYFVQENYYQAIKTYTYLPYLKKQTETLYDQTGVQFIKNETDYTYDPVTFQLKKTSRTSSKGDILETNFKYPIDFPANPVCSTMVSRNIIDPQVEVVSTTKIGAITKETAKVVTNYAYFNGTQLIKPNMISKSINGNTPEPELEINQYDNKGNILETKGKDGIFTSYIWGYNSQYLTAKVVNAQYVTVSGLINQSFLDYAVGGSDDDAVRNHLTALLNIPAAYPTIYTYKRLTGITSEMDYRGRKTYYDYNGLNQLIQVRDHENKVLKTFCYNYSGLPVFCTYPVPPTIYYNVQMSQVVYPNNCLPCQTPNPVTYTVPANIYSSTVSQAAADQLAQDDINANGQNYANVHGSCSGTNVTITYQNTLPTGGASGWMAVYRNIQTSQEYPFPIPPSGTGDLGCIPPGVYSLSITKSGNSWFTLFGTGCFTQSGLSALFGKVNIVPGGSCNWVTLELESF